MARWGWILCVAGLIAVTACTNARDRDTVDAAARTGDGGVGGDADSASDAETNPVPDPEATEILPALDEATRAHIDALLARGAMRGNARDVFAKIGDSITESEAFLADYGAARADLGAHGELATTVQYFATHRFDDGRNSFDRFSMSATAGWATADALEGGSSSPLARELQAIHPQWAVVMYGTNDLERIDASTYRQNLAAALDLIEGNDTVAVLSTIPPRRDRSDLAARVPGFNHVVRALAQERHLPLMDFWLALQPLPRLGIDDDGVHPSAFVDTATETYHAADLTEAGLAYGYNVRNLITLEMLDRLRRIAP